MRARVKNVVIGLFTLCLSPVVHAACDRLPAEGLGEHTNYRGDICTFEAQIFDYWINHRADAANLDALSAKMAQLPNSAERTDMFMEINRQTLKFRGELMQYLHQLLGAVGHLDVNLNSDPRGPAASTLHGFSMHFTRSWSEGTWPITEQSGLVTINLILDDQLDRGRVEICVDSECRDFDQNGQPGEVRDMSPR